MRGASKGTSMHRKWLVGGGIVVVATLGFGAVFVGALPSGGWPGAKKQGDKKPDVALEFASREVTQPQLATMPARIEFSGPLVAPGTAVLKARAAGTLLSLAVAEGARVRAGQVLGQIDLADVTSRVAERNANVAAARATLAQAERTQAQNERLAAQQFISSAAVDSSRAAVETARAQLNAATASADMARVSLRDAALVAPIAGIVAKRHVLPGEKISPEQPMLTIVDLARLELAGSVGTHEVSRLAPGMPVAVQVEGADQPVEGRIARIAPAAEPGTRSIGVTIALPNPKETLRAGQYAVVTAELADETRRLTVPATAVGQTSGQDHVWLIENGALARRAIMVGRRDPRDGRVEVLQGIQPTSTVLAARFENLREGAKAVVVAQKSAPVASAAASTPLVR
jgi:membrane fusion protein, multidrug efflux system